jgi:transcriptional regulator with XRE-family HTH domain
MRTKGPNPVDVEVGRRIRVHRMNAGLSQTELGDQIGVTFQQVQKYEKGANRVGASRLTQIATALNVPIPAFFEGANKAAREGGPTSPTELLTRPHALRLLKAYSEIEHDGLRSAIVRLIESISSETSGTRSK